MKRTVRKCSNSTRVLLLVCAAFFIGILFLPIWRIELDAPQYPEGLSLQLFADKISGDLEIINGLNHYIGMKSIRTEDFAEFRMFSYVFIFFAAATLLVALSRSKKGLYALLVLFVCFIFMAALDFYRWNYEYGHDLNPNAAIKVPGMAYQPPMLGYKKLLNFGAYAAPDTGGLLMFGVFFLLVFSVLKESGAFRFLKKKSALPVLLLFLPTLYSCMGAQRPVPIVLNQDDCNYCKMRIVSGHVGAELLTDKGKAYKFDDITCMFNYLNSNPKMKVGAFYCHNYSQDNVLIKADTAYFVIGSSIKTPMNGDIVGFSSEAAAEMFLKEKGGSIVLWGLLKKFKGI